MKIITSPLILGLLLTAIYSLSAQRNPHQNQKQSENLDVDLKNSYGEVIYFNGKVITLDDNSSIYQAVAIKKHIILAVGSDEDILKLADSHTKLINLNGKTMLPGFYDAHSHFIINSLQKSQGFDISPPPTGKVKKIQDVIDNVKQYLSSNKISQGQTVFGVGYSDLAFEQNRHLNKWDLDKISTKHAIMMLHSSMHMMAVNSYVLNVVNITIENLSNQQKEMFDIRNGQLTGLVKQLGLMKLKSLIIPLLQKQSLLENGFKDYYSVGYTTAQDILFSYSMGYIFKNSHTDYRNITSHYFPINIDAYLLLTSAQGADISWKEALKTKKDNFKVKGIKFILDGSIQGRTAFLNERYYTSSKHQAPYHPHPYQFSVDRNQNCLPPDCGIQSFKNQTLVNSIVAEIYHHGVDLITHCNGDAAADQLIQAVRYAKKKYPNNPYVPRIIMIHAQTVTESQLDQMVELGINPSFFPGHIYYWGYQHEHYFLGPKRASRMDPAFSALKRNLTFTLHNDACVTPIQPYGAFEIIWTAVNRLTLKENYTLGPEQRIPVEAALRAVTINAAWQARQQKQKGSIEVGKDADLIVVSEDPLTIDPYLIRTIRVLQTIKDGIILYTNPNYSNDLEQATFNQDLRLRRM